MIYLLISLAYWDDCTKGTALRGVYTDLNKAKEHVESHAHNLCEFYYNYIIIEGRSENTFDLMSKEEFWYELSMPVEGQTICTAIEKPEAFRSAFNFI